MDSKNRVQALERVIVEDICFLKYRKYQRDPFLLKRDDLEKHSKEIINYIENFNQITENQISELNAAYRYQIATTLFLMAGALLSDNIKAEALKSAT